MQPYIRLLPALLSLASSLALARNIPANPTVTPAPDPLLVDLRLRQNENLNPISVAQVLLTAFPASLVQVAATNPGYVPVIIWEEFLDGKTPEWFANLPPDIQTWLSEAYVGTTAPPASAAVTWSPEPSGVSQTPSESQSPITANPSSTPSPISSFTYIPSSAIISTDEPSPTSLQSSSASHSISTDPSSSSQTSSSTLKSEVTSLSTVLPSSTSAESTTASVKPSSPAAPTSEETPSGGGLPTRTKIGLGVGIPIGVLAIAGLLGLCLVCRRRRSHSRLDDDDYDDRSKHSDTAPFVSEAQLYRDNHHSGGPYDAAAYRDGEFGFHNSSLYQHHRRPSLPKIHTDPFMEPATSHGEPATSPRSLWLPTNTGYNNPPLMNGGLAGAAAAASAGHTSPSSHRHHQNRRGSLSQMTQIEEAEDESSDIGLAMSSPKRKLTTPAEVAAAATLRAQRRRANSGHSIPRVPAAVSPTQVQQHQRQISPHYQNGPDEYGEPDLSAAAALLPRPSFRSGSLKSYRKSSGIFPHDKENSSNSATSPIEGGNGSSSNEEGSPHGRPLARRKSLTIGGGYRSLPSPHLQPNGGW